MASTPREGERCIGTEYEFGETLDRREGGFFGGNDFDFFVLFLFTNS